MPRTTADRVLGAGGSVDGRYHALRAGPGESHSLRTDFVSGPAPDPAGRRIATLAHLTDLHVVDPGSPARLDFAMRTGAGDPCWGGLVDYVFRPHEALAAHAVAAMVGTLAAFDIDVCVVTGDNIDNAQGNELAAYLALLDGGEVALTPHGYHGPQRPDRDDTWYWRPDPGPDRYKQQWGFPTHPGLLELAGAPFTAPGLGHPWLACLGNHDLLVGGASAGYDQLRALVTGDRKPVALPDGFAVPDALGAFLTEPATLFAGPAEAVPALAERAFVGQDGFVAAHLRPGARPAGHGFTPANLAAGTAHYAYDPVPGLRIVVLNTNHPHGHWDGSMDAEQLNWLSEQLSADGPGDPLIVLASHHATTSLRNDYGVCPERAGERAYATEVARLALGCRNVVLWLNGHHHANRVVAHHRPGGGGLYEVTTAAVADWPCQARLLEISREPSGVVRITSTIVDHAAPPALDGPPSSSPDLATLHRELAFNDAARAGRTGAYGTNLDRNVCLRLPA